MFTDQAYEVLAQVPGGAHGIKISNFEKQKLKMLNKRISNFEKKMNWIYFYYISPCMSEEL